LTSRYRERIYEKEKDSTVSFLSAFASQLVRFLTGKTLPNFLLSMGLKFI
jgi:hypothetical protein